MEYAEARAIVQARLEPPTTTADYGAQDAEGYWVPYGTPEVLDGSAGPEAVAPETAAVVTKATGALDWLPYTADGVFDRLEAMEAFGRWPA